MEQNNCIINYIGSTSEGSSGGPLLNDKGNLIGINFGYFCTEGTLSPTKRNDPKQISRKSLASYDLTIAENTKNLNGFKNRNMAVSINHPCLQEWVGATRQNYDILFIESLSGKKPEVKTNGKQVVNFEETCNIGFTKELIDKKIFEDFLSKYKRDSMDKSIEKTVNKNKERKIQDRKSCKKIRTNSYSPDQ